MSRFYNQFLCKKSLLFLIIIFSTPVLEARESIPDFLDGIFKSQMKEHHIAGATFSLYSADTLTLTRSWGYSHVDEKRMADEETGFMVGSISKLFIWVAAMQLVEQGKLDLDQPINNYLTGFRLPESYKPVTMKHLMTHTPGFEDHMHLFSKDHTLLPELETYLVENLPAQIYDPGTTPAYSNYGAALAAYVVEQISDVNFNDYVDDNIFLPLNMMNTTFRQPASYGISEAKSKGYIFEDGRYVNPFEEYVIPAPAGSAVSTASDMAKFMNALLRCDEDPSDNILSNETISQMLSLLYSSNPHADGMAHGFMRLEYHGKEIFWHGGDTYFFHSAFLLIPAMKTGIFISINTANTNFNYLDQALLILDYLNGNKKELTISNRVNGMNHYAGYYKGSRKTENNYLKILSLLMSIKITGSPDGLLLHIPGQKPELYRPIEDDVFASDYKRIIFERDEDGKISRLVSSYLPIMVFEKMTLRENPNFNILLLVISLLIILRNILVPIYRFIVKDKRREQVYRWVLLLSGITMYIFFVMFFSTFNGVESVIFEKPRYLGLILALPFVSLVLFIAALFFWFKGGIGREQPLSSTLWQFAGFLIMVAFYMQLNFWNLFNFMI
jgi:CubicO group peptidase (beta-lactamase class C family)